jgi:dolichol-phosphate mannosyltransferase
MSILNMQHKRPDIAIVIPAWNERENLDLLLPALREVLEELGLAFEIVVADAGSDDGTREAAERRGARVVLQQERGYGGALLAGFAATTAPYIVTMDADLSHRPVFLFDFWKNRERAEVLIASRYIAGGKADMNRGRRVLSHILNRTYGMALSMPIRDLSSGFRMYRRDALDGLSLQSRDFDILEEILVRVHAGGWRILEVPFSYMARGSGNSHARLAKFAIAYLRTLGRMWSLRNSIESADYDYRAFDSRIWLQRYWQRTRYKIILKFAADHERVLDIGCGTSRIILDLQQAVGLDISERKLRWLKPQHERLVRGSCNHLPFDDASFDCVINSEVIEHVPDVPEIMTEMWRVLRPSGTLILGTPDYGRRLWLMLEWVYGKVMPGAYAHEHITRYTAAALTKRLREGGYDVLDCQYVGFCEMIFKARKPALSSAAEQGMEAKLALAASENVGDNAMQFNPETTAS